MKNQRLFLVLFLVFLFALLGFFVTANFPLIPAKNLNQTLFSLNKDAVKVLRVVDGDTIEVSLNSKKETVRLIGIDTPETVDPRKPVQCFGKEASDKAKEILIGKTIRLESDPTQDNRDKYGRLLRYVFLGDLNFNKLMIFEGYAHEYTYQNNPYKYQLEFMTAEKSARENKKGLWGECGTIKE